ncbi:unnamed protein product [Prorocentrum cordatum]|uniref:Uncharacterized protein n=1 Tax=Prorocentrum cordatum TaxID=2364126 RepID=A0ABN9TZB4_9DINO|nr:unnamed protein product [Polarella glacialis]
MVVVSVVVAVVVSVVVLMVVVSVVVAVVVSVVVAVVVSVVVLDVAELVAVLVVAMVPSNTYADSRPPIVRIARPRPHHSPQSLSSLAPVVPSNTCTEPELLPWSSSRGAPTTTRAPSELTATDRPK